MFTITLPVAKEQFTIKPFLFNNVIDIARLSYENDEEGVITYLNNHFNTHSLCIIDKFFVLLKARQLWVNETVRIKEGGKYIELHMSNLLKCFENIKLPDKVISDGLLTIHFRLPKTLISDSNADTYIETIKSISIQNTCIEFDNLTREEQQDIVSKLPSSTLKLVREYYNSVEWSYTLFQITKKNLKITIDFLSDEPFNLINTLYTVYDIHYCREILLYLSKKVSPTVIYQSTMPDIEYYITETYTDDSNPTPML